MSSNVFTHKLVLDSDEGAKVEPELIRLRVGTSLTVRFFLFFLLDLRLLIFTRFHIIVYIQIGRSRQKCSVVLASSRGPLMISRVHATLEPVPSETGEGKFFFLIFNLFFHHIQGEKSLLVYSSNLTHDVS